MGIFGLDKKGRFSHGIHPAYHKEETARLAIKRLPFPPRLVLPLNQHIGKPARAVVKNPSLVLADEPTANLDSATSASILELMDDLNREGITFVFSSHDPAVIERAHRVLRLQDGRIQSNGEVP